MAKSKELDQAPKAETDQVPTKGPDWVPATSSAAELAPLFGVSTRTIRDYDERDILVRVDKKKKGQFETLPSLHAYIAHLREQAAGRATSNGRNLADEKAEDVRISREIKEMKLAEMRRESVPLAELTESWTAFAAVVKASILSLPSKARTVIPHLTAHDGASLRTLCRDLLEDMAKETESIVVMGDPKQLEDDGRSD